MPHRTRHALLGLAMAALTAAQPAAAQPRLPQAGLSAYGMPGLIDMPTATALPDGTLAFTGQVMPGTWRGTFAFQALPRVTVSFRYAAARIGFGAGGVNHDRSFDLHWLVMEQGEYLPAVAVGLRDFIGTGIYSSEYIVATRTFSPRLRASLGIGWGRMATHGSFTNPLAVISDRFRTRPGGFTGTGGQVEFGRFFRGPAALFAGVEYQATDRLTVMAEYSSDAYVLETGQGMRYRTPLNLGFRYQWSDATTVSGYMVHGSNIGIAASFALNPARPSSGPVRITAPAPVRLRPAPPTGGDYSTAWAEGRAAMGARLQTALAPAMEAEGLRLDGIELEPQRAVVRFTNQRHEVLPRALGRTARVLTYGLPESVEEIVLIPMHNGVPGAAVVMQRSDLERLQYDPDGSAQLLASTRFADPLGFAGVGRAWQPLPAGRQRFQWSVGPYLDLSYFDPTSPVRADFGLRAHLRYAFAENLSVNAVLSQRLFGNIDGGVTTAGTPGYPQVRTHAALYSSSGPVVDRLTLDYTMRPARNLYARLTLGWMERMYAGVSAEVLWSPADSRLALGAELNYVAQRDPDAILGVNDLRRVTGHVSAYYDFGHGFLGQVDVGQYLAGDIGATVRLERAFANGIRVGAFATLTDMPFAVFGEGSFDKGITITIPATALTGRPSTTTFGTTIRSLTRDGGAMLSVPGRLYPTIQDSRAQTLRLGWGAVLQ